MTKRLCIYVFIEAFFSVFLYFQSAPYVFRHAQWASPQISDVSGRVDQGEEALFPKPSYVLRLVLLCLDSTDRLGAWNTLVVKGPIPKRYWFVEPPIIDHRITTKFKFCQFRHA